MPWAAIYASGAHESGLPAPILQLPDPEAVASLQATPQAVVRSFYPIAGNEAAMGHDLLRGALGPG
jgi:hypothetical protein